MSSSAPPTHRVAGSTDASGPVRGSRSGVLRWSTTANTPPSRVMAKSHTAFIAVLNAEAAASAIEEPSAPPRALIGLGTSGMTHLDPAGPDTVRAARPRRGRVRRLGCPGRSTTARPARASVDSPRPRPGPRCGSSRPAPPAHTPRTKCPSSRTPLTWAWVRVQEPVTSGEPSGAPAARRMRVHPDRGGPLGQADRAGQGGLLVHGGDGGRVQTRRTRRCRSPPTPPPPLRGCAGTEPATRRPGPRGQGWSSPRRCRPGRGPAVGPPPVAPTASGRRRADPAAPQRHRLPGQDSRAR